MERNHYDRVVHFLFGLMFFLPFYEILSKKFKIKGQWGFLLVFLILAAFKGIFEVIEYLHIVITKSEIFNINYLGMQGDFWDAQKDMLMGLCGAAIAWGISFISLRRKKTI